MGASRSSLTFLPPSWAPFFAADPAGAESARLPAFLHPHKSMLKVSRGDTSRFRFSSFPFTVQSNCSNTEAAYVDEQRISNNPKNALN